MSLFAYLRPAVVRMARNPGLCGLVILLLSIAIASTTALFSLVHGILIAPLPYPEAHELVLVMQKAPATGMRRVPLSDAGYLHYRAYNASFEELAVFREDTVNFSGLEATSVEPERVRLTRASPNLLQVLGRTPAVGRWWSAEESRPGASPVAVLGHDFWVRRFGADPGVLGQRVRIEGVSTEIVGLMPQGFAFPFESTQLWVPLELDPVRLRPGNHHLRGVARLRPGVTAAEAEADLEGLIPGLSERYPQVYSPRVLTQWGFAASVEDLKAATVQPANPTLWILMTAAGLVLVIACANVAGLFLVRSEERSREVALKRALGAGRRDLLVDCLLEPLLLALASGGAGLLLAAGALRLVRVLAPAGFPRLGEVAVDTTVLLFAAALSTLCGVACGLVPALGATTAGLILGDGRGNSTPWSRGPLAGRAIPSRSAPSQSAPSRSVRSVLVVSEVALAMTLLAASGLLVRTVGRLEAVEPGFEAGGVLTLGLSLPAAQYGTPEAVAGFYGDLLDALERLPGVESVGAVTQLPLAGSSNLTPVWVEDSPVKPSHLPHPVETRYASAGYFRTLEIPLLAGRTLPRVRDAPGSGSPPREAVVNAALAELLWPGQDPLGKGLRPGPEAPAVRVVGVVGDTRDQALDQDPPGIAYYPLVTGGRSLSLVLRTRGSPQSVVASVRHVVHSLDPGLPVQGPRTLAEVTRASTRPVTTVMLLLTGAASLALVLAATGVYAFLAYLVRCRTPEIGIRMALGARPADVHRLVLEQALGLTAVGMACGLAATLALQSLLGRYLFGVAPTDPPTLIAVSVLLLAAALAAALRPAHRAVRIDPVVALRRE